MAKPTFRDIITSKSKDMDMSFRRGFDQFDNDSNNKTSGSNSRYALWFIAVASIVLLFFVLSYFFTGAVVSITPKNNSVPLEGVNFSAIKSSSTDKLRFEIMTVKGDESTTISST